MSITAIRSEETPVNDNNAELVSPYTRYAEIFSRVYRETNSIPLALEVLDTHRGREDVNRRKLVELPKQIVAGAARLFGVAPHRLYEADRHGDVVAARRVAAWMLHRLHWSTLKIGAFFHQDHSTVLTGLRRVAASQDLLVAAHKAEVLLELQLNRTAEGTTPRSTVDASSSPPAEDEDAPTLVFLPGGGGQ